MSTCDGTRNIRAVPRRNQRHERLTKTVVTSPLRKSWPSKPNPIYTLEGLAVWLPRRCDTLLGSCLRAGLARPLRLAWAEAELGAPCAHTLHHRVDGGQRQVGALDDPRCIGHY